MIDYNVVLRCINDIGEKYDLELDDDFSIEFDISAIEVGEIGSNFGISSKEIILPGTTHNNKFFNNLFNLGATPAISLTKTVPCQILADGQAIFTGKLYVNDIITDEYNEIYYNCTIHNEVIDFKIVNQDKTMQELDWSYYGHKYIGVNVEASWTNGLFFGDVYYPLIDYGKSLLNKTAPDISYAIPQPFINPAGYINSPLTPAQVYQFKPALRLKSIVDTIFQQTNYKYTSSFFETDYFKSIYYLGTPDGKEGVSFVSGSSLLAFRTTDLVTLYDDPEVNFEANDEAYDTANAYNPTTYEYIVPVNGNYTFDFHFEEITAQLPPLSLYTVDGCVIRIRYEINGFKATNQDVTEYTWNIPNWQYNPAGFYETNNVNMKVILNNVVAGDVIKMYIDFDKNLFKTNQFPTGTTMTIKGGQNNCYFTVTSPQNPVGQDVDMGKIFPSNLKVLDFIKGLIHKWNLVIEPIPNEKNIFKIEPYDYWINDKQIVDWTQRVDRSINFKIEHPIKDGPKTIIFTDKEDEDYLQANFQAKDNKFTFGMYKRIDDSDFIEGEETIGDLFGATPVKEMTNTSIPIPHLYTHEDGKDKEPFNFEPRLLHRAELKPPGPWYFDVGGAIKTVNRVYTLLPFVNPDGSTGWPITRTNNVTDQIDIHYGTYGSPNLPSGNNQHYITKTDPKLSNATNGLYNLYWANYIESIYNIDARKLTCNVLLTPEDIKNLRLNDQIFIDGHYYRINKVNSADVGKDKSTEVELVKLTGRTFPRGGIRRITKTDG